MMTPARGHETREPPSPLPEESTVPTPAETLRERLQRCDSKSEKFAVEIVQLLIDHARESHASDLHLVPNSKHQLDVLCRIDGLLQPVACIESAASNIVSRLKVLADLLTYRTDLPQEGRIRHSGSGADSQVEMRVSTFPTVHGEKAVVRLFVGSGKFLKLEDVGNDLVCLVVLVIGPPYPHGEPAKLGRVA